MTTKLSFYWYDLETFGIDAARDRIAQFAGVRTDMELNIISDPLVLYCKITPDILPQPESCLITGITPQLTLEKGVNEIEFVAAILKEFSTPHTCVAGFNNIRFDDEFMRYAFYRNFYDPYAREWQNGCSRWDIIDLVRITRALRPEGIHWPVDAEGHASNRLELLTKANAIEHTAAHDAMSDVYATLAVARLIKQKQPRLYDYIYQHKTKDEISKLLDLKHPTPVLHASDMFPSSVCNTAMVLPLAPHPTNKNGIIVYDLRYDPQALIALDADDIRRRIYTPREQLPEGVERIALKTVHLNKCPVVVPLNTLDEASAQRLQLDRAAHEKHRAQLLGANLAAKIKTVFSDNPFPPHADPELALYNGFLDDNDRQRLAQVRDASADELATLKLNFKDTRLPELLFRYRARNYPNTLNDMELQRWQEYRQRRLNNEDGGNSLTLPAFRNNLSELKASNADKPEKLGILNRLDEYAATLE
jgi:exodeoxyribonuclease-1